MSAVLLDGKALSVRMRERLRQKAAALPRPAGSGGDPGGGRPRQRRIRPQQGERLRPVRGAVPEPPSARRSHPAGAAGAGGGHEPPGGRGRDPGAAASAGGAGQPGRAGGHPPGEGRGRLPPGECGSPDAGAAPVPALHPRRDHGPAAGVWHLPRRETLCGGGPQQHRGKAHGPAASGGGCHRHRLPQPHAGSGGAVPPGGYPHLRRGSPWPHHLRHGQARRRGRGCGYEPQ